MRKKNYTQLLVINDVNVHSHHTPSQSKGVGTALPRRTTGMPLKSKPKLPVTIKLQSRCWFYFGKKKKAREKERGGGEGVYVEEQKEGRRGGGSLATSGINLSARGGTGRDGWGLKKEAEEEEKNQMKIRTDTQEKEECG